MMSRPVLIVSLVALVTILMISCHSPHEWIEKSGMIYPRGEHASTVVNGEIYVFGGIFDHYLGPPYIEKYNPETDKWTSLGEWENPKHHITAGASVWGDEVWLCGGKWGGVDGVTNRVDIYNTSSNTWRRGPDLPELHWGGPSVIVDHFLHVLTGAINKTNTTDHHYRLDLNNENAGWRVMAPVPNPRVHIAGVELDGKIYLIGGEYHHAHDGDTPTMQVYDPATDSWDLTKASMPIARSHHEWATFTFNGKIISVSGVDSANKEERGQSEILIYSPETDQWNIWKNLPFDMTSTGAKAVDGFLYVFGGGYDDWLPVHGKTFATSIEMDMEQLSNNTGY